MVKDIKDIQKEVETVFNARVDHCAFIRPFVLEVKFAELTDIFDTKTKGYPKTMFPKAKRSEIIALQASAPVVILRNCYISSADAEKNLSDNLYEDRKIGSHFFHKDFFGFGGGEDAPSTVLFNPLNVHRDAPTYYALVDSVKEAVTKLSNTPSYSGESHKLGFEELSAYQYMSADSDFQIMHFVNATLGQQFTQVVFDQIKDEDKISIDWKKDGNVVVLHSNFSDVAHARPAMGDNINNMSAIDLV
ncbi:MAG: hypothetical protein COB36_05680 [Alphaproteobacteria bacterium]|nr:MAG: hypothetical protein COB36_05680 [Alphaproteobacteria bacterium]